MAHHAYFLAGEQDKGVARARLFAEETLGLSGATNSDVVVLQFGLFSVDDARKLMDIAYRSGEGDQKVILASMTRIFHEAQNALLKLLEEPPEGVTIILQVPSEGLFIPTLRSRLLPLPGSRENGTQTLPGIAEQFLAAETPAREKLTAGLIDRSKSDKDESKQAARQEAIDLLNGLTQAAHIKLTEVQKPQERKELVSFLEDLSSFIPILYERSAPLKLIFEHLLLVIPRTLANPKV